MHYSSTAQGTCCVEICTYIYIHEIVVEKKKNTVHHFNLIHLYEFVSGGGGGEGEKRLIFVCKNFFVLMDDP